MFNFVCNASSTMGFIGYPYNINQEYVYISSSLTLIIVGYVSYLPREMGSH